MACVIELETAKHYRDLDRRDRAACIAEQMRDDLLLDWIADMTNNCDDIRRMFHLMVDDDIEFFDTLRQLPALARSQSNPRDLLLAALAEKLGRLIHDQADSMFGEDLEDAKFQELVR
jgi:hypothetical protein